MKKFFKNGLVCFLGLLTGFLLPLSAAASSVQSDYGYYSVYGYDYQNYSTIRMSNYAGYRYAYASTGVSCTSTTSVPAGYFGAKSRIYDVNGQVVIESSYTFSNGPAGSWYAPTVSTSGFDGGTLYYSKGATAAYNGDGYDYYVTFQTPFLSIN